MRLSVSVFALVAAISAARADTPAINPTTVGSYPPLTNNGFNYYQGPGGYTFTWDFTANSAINITQLGYYDSVLAGTAEPGVDGFGVHTVSLQDVTTSQTLATTLVTGASAATGVFNYNTIAPVTLNTSDTYQVSGTMTDQYYLVGLNQAAAPVASVINYQYGPEDIFGTNGPAGTYNDFGPDFQFTAGTGCTENRPGRDVIALAGDVCAAAAGAYAPTTTAVALPVTYNGFGFYAHGGTINSPGAISIVTSNPNQTGGSYGVWADTVGSTINLNGASSVTTAGANSHGVYASGGGLINAPLSLSATTTGAGAFGLYASGAGSSITATLGTISTSGASATGAQADNGGALTLTGGNVTTSGASAYGLYATGANSQITATGVAVSTTGGNFANAVYADNGGSISLKGGSVQTGGDDVYAVVATPGGTLTLLGTSVAATGLGAGGVGLNGSTTSFTGTGVTIVTHGDFDAQNNFGAAGLTNQGFGENTGGGVVYLTSSTITTTGSQAVGAANQDAGSMTISGGAITTGGANSVAVLSLTGATTTLSGVKIQTTGDESDGIYNGSGGGSAAGPTGAGAVSATGVTISTGGASARGIVSENGGSTTFSIGSVTTSGVQADAVLGTSGSATQLTGVQLTTTGNAAKGLNIDGSGTTLIGSQLTISTSGTLDPTSGFKAEGVYNGSAGSGGAGQIGGGSVTLSASTISTSGAGSGGIYTADGGATKVTGGSVTTGGATAAAVDLGGAGTVALSGVALTTTGAGSVGLLINGSLGAITASNLTIATSGGVDPNTTSHADGVYNGTFLAIVGGGTMTITDSSVKTSGAEANGVSAGPGGSTTFLGGSIATSGFEATAALAANGGALTIGVDAAGQGTAISTKGAGSYAAVAQGGGFLSLAGVALTTTNDGAGGIGVNGSGSEVDATGVTIATAGAYDSVSGLHAYGVYNGAAAGFASGGVAKLTDVAVSTQGAGMFGVDSGIGGVTTFNGGSVTTAGSGAFGLYANGAGASLTTTGVTVATAGAGAFGAAALSGGALTLGPGTQVATTGAGANALDVSNAAATLNGAVTLAASGTGAAALSVDSGGTVTANGSLTLTSAAAGIVVNGGAGTAASVSLAGPLSLTTGGSALTLNGDGATFSGTGGGIITSSSVGVSLIDGVNQTATFDNYTINNVSGDLIFADPSTSTVNFNSTIANAGTGNLADVTNGSVVTINANASTLIGAVQTEAGAVSNLNLSNGSTWSITGNSTVSNLSLSNSSASFAAPGSGGFKTLTVGSYTGTGASLTFNALLSGASPGADQLVINGGQATGSTKVFINPVAFLGQTVSARSTGVPLIVTANGGTIAPGAFTLAGPVTADGYVFTLQPQNGDDYLVANQGLSPSQASGSLSSLSQSRQSQTITNRVLTSILTGATEQISCSSCSSGFASFGSFAFGAHGRWTLSPSLALLAGASFDSYSAKGVSVPASIDLAAALRYDMVQLGRYRPFLEAGVAVAPMAEVKYNRGYASSLGGATGQGEANSHSLSLYGRAGYIWRLSPIDEAAVYSDLTRSWETTTGYTESASPGNPFGAIVAPTFDTLNIWKTGAQYTHLFGQHIEVNVSAGYALAFGANYGTAAVINGFGGAVGAAPSSFDWAELGGRVSYRFSKNLIGDVFVLGTVGAQPAGSQVHGGVALRAEF